MSAPSDCIRHLRSFYFSTINRIFSNQFYAFLSLITKNDLHTTPYDYHRTTHLSIIPSIQPFHPTEGSPSYPGSVRIRHSAPPLDHPQVNLVRKLQTTAFQPAVPLSGWRVGLGMIWHSFQKASRKLSSSTHNSPIRRPKMLYHYLSGHSGTFRYAMNSFVSRHRIRASQ